MGNVAGYFADLRKRLTAKRQSNPKASEAALARAAKMHPVQLSRLFNDAPDVRLSTVLRLESALTSL